jgi:predicted permease
MNTRAFIDSVARDFHYAMGSLRKSPGFTATATATLALGVGANIAIFSLVNTVLLKRLPLREPEKIVAIYEDFSQRGGPANLEPSPAAFLAWRTLNERQSSPVLEDVAAMNGFDSYNLTGQGEPERLNGVAITGNLFPLIGLNPLIGRTLLPEDERPNAPNVAVVSEGLWRRRFGADPSLVGRSISLNGVKYEVVGVIPGALQFPTPRADVWVPLIFPPDAATKRFSFVLTVVGRLRPGVRIEQAHAAVASFSNSLLEKFPRGDRIGVTIRPLRDVLITNVRPTLILLLATVGVVLLIACANVAQLLMARGAGRRQEIALRSALGARRGRIIQQLLAESLVLAGLAALVGTGLALSTFWFLVRLIPDTFPTGTSLSMDLRVVAFTVVLAGITTAIFGIGPAYAGARFDTSTLLRRGTARGVTGAFRGFLTASEVALTVVLLIAAGLLLQSLANLRAVNPGFGTSNLLLVETVLPMSKYAAFAARMSYLGDVLGRIAGLPGVLKAGYTNFAPFGLKGGRTGFTIEGRPDPRPSDGAPPMAVDRVITADYFATMGIPVLSGRVFDRQDTDSSPEVVVISQAMARTYWPERDPVGQRIKIGAGPDANPWFTIIGVVADSRQISLDQAVEPALYFPMTQSTTSGSFFLPRHLVIRTAGDPIQLASQVRQVISSIDPEQPVSKIQNIGQVLDSEVTGRNTQLTLVAAFALLALALAFVGLYGVLSYTVAQSAPEIGIRMALGARRPAVISMVLQRTFWWAGCGLAAGLFGAMALGRLIQPFLYQTHSNDPLTFAGVGGLVLVVAILASWLPAARAASIEPMRTLRSE